MLNFKCYITDFIMGISFIDYLCFDSMYDLFEYILSISCYDFHVDFVVNTLDNSIVFDDTINIPYTVVYHDL